MNKILEDLNEYPLVSIIIVNFNGKTYLKKCLESLSKINYEKYEIIIVDNNSTDGSLESIEQSYPNIKIKKLEKNFGFAYPNNRGVELAKGKFILFLNNDTIVDPDFINKLLVPFENDPEVGICQSLLLKPTGEIDSSGDFIDSIGIAFSSKIKSKKTHKIFSAKGASMIIKKEIFEKLGGFDEKFFLTFEDVDLGWRTWMLGYKVLISPDSIVHHLGSHTIKKINSDISFHGTKNQISMKITNFELIESIKSLFLFFLFYGTKEIKIWLDYKTKGKTQIHSTNYEDVIALKPNFKAIFRALIWLLCNMSYLYKKRNSISKTRKYTTKQLKKLNVIIDTK